MTYTLKNLFIYYLILFVKKKEDITLHEKNFLEIKNYTLKVETPHLIMFLTLTICLSTEIKIMVFVCCCPTIISHRKLIR